MKERKKFSSGVIWEDIVGYSRAVKIDDRILVSGTTAILDGKIVGKDDMYLQTRTIIEKIESVLIQAGSSLEDIIRLRIFVTDIGRWEEAGKALGEKFRTIKPAQTLVGISALVDPDMLVEIEAEAITSS